MLETREIFRNFPFALQIAFYVVAFGTLAVFIFGFYKRIKKYKKGRDAGRFNNLAGRFFKALATMGSNSTVMKRDSYAGIAHWLIFWGFIVLLIGTALVALDHDFLRFLGIHLLKGNFYLVFSLALDVFGLAFLVGLLMMMFRRAKKPAQLDYSRSDLTAEQYTRKGYSSDDKIFLWLLFLIGLTGFLIEGVRIAADRPAFEVWSPVGWYTANLIDALGMTASANSIHLYSWWLHAVLVMVFIAYIPYSKAMHMLVDYANLMFKDDLAAKRLPRVSEEQMANGMGYKTIEDFTWKELLDYDSCTKCGRCHIACPAQAAGTPLSPRDLILDMRTWVDANSGTNEWFGQAFSSDKKKTE
ncbi:MAG: 4Fe-4S binding protein, partial [Cyclobacteriaceae bacterium]|nr:4Fe-4S binding protein [Cyclobacteriaceae bacterium]